MSSLTPADTEAIERQLGRMPRGAVEVAHRCPCGEPDVVTTAPRLPDGTPFPTTYYLTCPRAAAAIGTLESSGLMRDMEARLASDPGLAAAYRSAHEAYLAGLGPEAPDPAEMLEGFARQTGTQLGVPMAAAFEVFPLQLL